jgi:hypothetical protein
MALYLPLLHTLPSTLSHLYIGQNMNNKKILKFSSEESLSDIKPSKNFVPDWYKNVQGFNTKNMLVKENGTFPKNFKSCMPFFDSFASGYTVELWCDVHFKLNDDGSHHASWGSARPIPIASRNPLDNPMPVPNGYEPKHYVWQFPYNIQTPKDYSILITHPINRFDLPFLSLSGIVDSDSVMGRGNIPFFIKDNFEGVIEAGTPILQIIPFKRDNWITERDSEIDKIAEYNRNKSNRKFFGYYKDNIWKRKDYS